MSATSDFLFCGQKMNGHMAATLKILYFVVMERMAVKAMAVWVHFSKYRISLLKKEWQFEYSFQNLVPRFNKNGWLLSYSFQNFVFRFKKRMVVWVQFLKF